MRRCRGCSCSPADGCQRKYGRQALARLVEGFVWDERANHGQGGWIEVKASWEDMRSYVERTGNVESEGWLEVLDLERAAAALAKTHPTAYLIVLAAMHGGDRAQMDELFGGLEHIGWCGALDKAEAFLSAWLSGREPEKAWKRTHEGRDR